MPALFVFLLKVNIALLLFCAGYYLVLRHLTFYTLNRIYLIAAILFATIYPKINLDGFAQRHQQLAKPVQIVVSSFETPAQALVKPLTQPGYWYWIEAAFWLGAIVLALRLLTQLFSLYKLHRASVPMQIRNHKVRIIHGNANPFSFWRSIYVNPANHTANDLKAILQHEQIHVNEWHTLDVLLAEISTIFYWFNPGIWLMKKAVKENIEFITDRKIVNNGIDAKQYQYSLVNVSFAASPQSIVNHFNISTIKKRIIMMNAKRSSNTKLTRYAFVLPAVIICLLTFSFSKAELIKKSKVAYKTITASVEKINPVHILSDSLKNDTIKIIAKKAKGKNVYLFSGDSSKKINIVVADGKATGYNTYNLSTDTLGKLGGIIRKLQFTHDLKNDSNIVIYVNGVKRTDLKGLDPADIQTINIHGDTTGKRITKVRINGKPITGLAGTSTINLDYNYSYSPNDKNEKVVVGHPSRSITIVGGNGAIRKTLTIDTLTGGDVKLFRGEPMVINMMRKKEVSIDHISDKLIIIDGKEATSREFKKLSAADIESMSAKSGDEVTKQYGDKAKNGVLLITTKKSK